MTNDDLKSVVYEPMRELRQKFYESKNQEEWNELKIQLKSLFEVAQQNMDSEFYGKYHDGVVNSIQKIYTFKEKAWSKQQKQFQPKITYLLQDDLASALMEYIQLKTIQLNKEINGGM